MALWNPSASVIAATRAYALYKGRRGSMFAVLRRLTRIRHGFWSFVTASDIALGARLGAGLRLPHPNGVVIHQDAIIGDDCMIMQQVTIGQTTTDGAPTLGAHVYVGAGAKILGTVSIGARARIGANAVVLQDVPPDRTAVGIPARLVPIKTS